MDTHRHAFTLLELLLALSMLTIISAFIAGWLTQAQHQVHDSQQALEAQRGLLSAMTVLRHDFLMQPDLTTQSALSISEHELTFKSCHATIADPTGMHSVRWFIEENQLLRQIDQQAPRVVCPATPGMQFGVDDGTVYLQRDGDMRLRINPVAP